MPISRIIAFELGCYFVASRLEVLLDEDDSRSSSRASERGSCMWQSRHSEVNVYFIELSEQTGWLSTLTSLSPFLLDLRLRFRLRVCLYLHVQQTLAHNSGRMTMHSQVSPLVSEPSGCPLTGRPVLDNLFFWFFGWIYWESSPLPATSESSYFIQLFSKEIFGGSRGDAYTFSYMISPDSIIIAFGIQ